MRLLPARISGANTKVGGRFGMKRCGPSCRRTRSASAIFKIFVLHPKKTFATISARNGHVAVVPIRPLSGDQRALVRRAPRAAFDPLETLATANDKGTRGTHSLGKRCPFSRCHNLSSVVVAGGALIPSFTLTGVNTAYCGGRPSVFNSPL